MKRFLLSGAVAVWAMAAGAAAWAAPGEAITDPEQGGADFALQGEYLGTVQTDEGEKRVGAQVIALGEGKFQIVGYAGGLPGDGWSRGDEAHKVEGVLKDGAIVAGKEGYEGRIADGAITITAPDGRKFGELKQVHRESPTLGAKPPEGAVVLFDGSSADGWENGKLLDGGLLGATNCTSKEKFGDHKLHVEFRTPFMPAARGQGRGNSGVYVQSRYEVQVLDSFGLDGANNECGGIYSMGAPRVNMCLPPLSWQTYDIEFRAARYDDQGNKTENARITIYHNGVLIHENLELKGGTPGKDGEGPGPLGVFFQDHGNPVAFRNVWAVRLD